MSSTVKLGSTQERHVVGLAEMLHQLWHELIRGQAAETAVLRRNDHMEALVRIGDLPFGLQPPQCSPDRRDRLPQRHHSLLGGEVVLAARGEFEDVRGSSGHDSNDPLPAKSNDPCRFLQATQTEQIQRQQKATESIASCTQWISPPLTFRVAVVSAEHMNAAIVVCGVAAARAAIDGAVMRERARP